MYEILENECNVSVVICTVPITYTMIIFYTNTRVNREAGFMEYTT